MHRHSWCHYYLHHLLDQTMNAKFVRGGFVGEDFDGGAIVGGVFVDCTIFLNEFIGVAGVGDEYVNFAVVGGAFCILGDVVNYAIIELMIGLTLTWFELVKESVAQFAMALSLATMSLFWAASSWPVSRLTVPYRFTLDAHRSFSYMYRYWRLLHYLQRWFMICLR